MIRETEIYQVVNRAARLLSASVAWLESLDPATRRFIIEMIQRDQLTAEGVDEDGDVLGLYSRATELLSGGKKKEGDPYNLNDSGAFYRSMRIIVSPDSMLIDGDTEKMEGEPWWVINNISAEKVLGLTDENQTRLALRLEKQYIEYVKKTLYGT